MYQSQVKIEFSLLHLCVAFNDVPMNFLILLPFVAKIEDFLKQDRLLAPHCRYYVREMRIQAYTQLLESYRSLTLQYMANAFGVSEEFIDR